MTVIDASAESDVISFPSHAITIRTKMIIVNTPHNPVGKVFTKAELEKIVTIAEEFNLLVMADEVVRHVLNCVASGVD